MLAMDDLQNQNANAEWPHFGVQILRLSLPEQQRRVRRRSPTSIFSMYVALTYIPGGGLLTGFAMRSDPKGFSGLVHH